LFYIVYKKTDIIFDTLIEKYDGAKNKYQIPCEY